MKKLLLASAATALMVGSVLAQLRTTSCTNPAAAASMGLLAPPRPRVGRAFTGAMNAAASLGRQGC